VKASRFKPKSWLRKCNRGATLTELLIVVALNAVALGAISALYTYSVYQVGHAVATVAATDQVSKAMDDICTTVEQSVLCTIGTNNGVDALECYLPKQAVDDNSDGVPDRFDPVSIDQAGRPLYERGKITSYYFSNSAGTFGTPGTYLWRATRNAAGDTPTPQPTWALYYGNAAKPRYHLINFFQVVVDERNRSVTVTLEASSLDRADRAASGTTANNRKQVLRLSRTVYWRNGRT
jgi:hypothetical protein